MNTKIEKLNCKLCGCW